MTERFGIKIDLPAPFLQKHLEAYLEELKKLTKGVSLAFVPAGTLNGHIVRAAAALGWVKGVAPEKVPDTHPGHVKWAANEIALLVNEAQEIPPN